MTALLEVTTPAAKRWLTTVARVRSDLALSAVTYPDATVEQMIESASAAIAAFLNIASDGEAPVTLARETLRETFRPSGLYASALILARAPLADLILVDEDGVVSSRLLSGADGAIDVGAAPTLLNSALGPAGAPFTAAHVGKAVVVAGAGAAGASLSTTIAAIVSPTAVTLAAAASTTVSGAAFTVENPSFGYEWRRGASLVHKVSGSCRVPFSAARIVATYAAGWLLPDAAARNLPPDIEDACLLLIRRKLDQMRECENPRIKQESWAGIGSWAYELTPLEWVAGLTNDVARSLERYKRRSV